MLGGIIGDVSGSFLEVVEIDRFKNKIAPSYEERIKILDRDVPLFNEKTSYTDDTIGLVSIAQALLTDGDYEKHLKESAKKELDTGLDIYGRPKFNLGHIEWVYGRKDGDSYGSGGANRASPIAYYYNDIEDIVRETRKATIVSHNHPEAINSALAVNIAIFLARNNYSKEDIKIIIEKYCCYDLNFDLEDLEKNYTFKVRAKNIVPQAIYCFLIADDFEDAIRKALSIGGDSDTIASITGSISEAYYGIPDKLIEEIKTYLPDYIKEILNEFYKTKGKELRLIFK